MLKDVGIKGEDNRVNVNCYKLLGSLTKSLALLWQICDDEFLSD